MGAYLRLRVNPATGKLDISATDGTPNWAAMVEHHAVDQLRIDALAVPQSRGLLGLTLCPGKHQTGALSRASWQRNLDEDLKVIQAWGAGAVITLNESAELADLKVPHIGDKVLSLGMAWIHMPIKDQYAPDNRFMATWPELSETIHGWLDMGERILIHCKGGLGRTGTVAAMLLIERGINWKEAMHLVRQSRPGSIETSIQEAFLETFAQNS